MSEVFLKIVNMSISASWLVLAVLVLRLILRKAPKWIRVLLWGIVAVRLIFPFSIESVLSLIPSAQTVSPEIMMDWTPEISTGITSLDSVVNPIITQSFAPKPYASANPLQILIPVCGNLWVLGIIVMLLYTAVSYLLLRRKVSTAVLLRENIYQSECVASPFVLGVIKPRIYLPFQIDIGSVEYVISHEQAHIRRKDHLWKPLGFLLLAIHWFNPLMWLGYILLCKDIELACDEKVIKKLDSEAKADYTQALVSCSVNRRSIAACPLAFGEVGVKARVKSILHYKKPAFWVIVAAVMVCVAVAVCFLTDPKTQPQDDPIRVTYTESKYLARSGKNSVPLRCFSAGTVIADYVDSVYWLTVDPGNETVPFSIWDGDKEIHGHYNAFDAQTFEPIGYFVPSGLDPQTYLFQNADPARRYIVIAVFSTEPTAQVYAFGAEFPDTELNAPEESYPIDLKTYYKNADGTWQLNGRNYRYRLVITGRMPNALADSTFVYLSNLETITFEQAWKAAGLSSDTADYFSVEDAVLVAWTRSDNTDTTPDTPVQPEQITDIVKATLVLPHSWSVPRTVTDPEILRKIEGILQRSEVLESGAGCLFTGMLTLTLADGEILILTMSEDNCATWLSNGTYYHYGQTTSEGVTNNDELYDLFTSP